MALRSMTRGEVARCEFSANWAWKDEERSFCELELTDFEKVRKGRRKKKKQLDKRCCSLLSVHGCVANEFAAEIEPVCHPQSEGRSVSGGETLTLKKQFCFFFLIISAFC